MIGILQQGVTTYLQDNHVGSFGQPLHDCLIVVTSTKSLLLARYNARSINYDQIFQDIRAYHLATLKFSQEAIAKLLKPRERRIWRDCKGIAGVDSLLVIRFVYCNKLVCSGFWSDVFSRECFSN